MKNLFFIIAIILLLLPFGVLYADHGGPHPDGGLENPIGSKAGNLTELIDAILELVVKIGGPIVAIFIIYSGFLFVTAKGNPEKISTAKTTFFWTIIGAAIVLGALVISTAIEGTVKEITTGL